MSSRSARSPVRTQCLLALCGSLAVSGCASKYVRVPARFDLAPYGRIALVTFSAEPAHSGMSTLATQRFAEALLAGQAGIELLELSAADSSLRGLPANADGAALAQALGREKDVPAVFVGDLRVSGMQPRGQIDGSGMRIRATVSAELSVRLLSTRTGGTVWRSSSAARGTVGQLAISGGVPAMAVRDLEAAYGEVVRALVTGVTRDLRPTWVKQ